MKTILIAEDNELNLELLSTILSVHNYNVLTASNGNEAISTAKSHQPDVVLMDIQMPGLDGHEALEALRADPKTSHIPVIAVTGNAMPHDLRKINDAGFNGVVNKPFRMADLLQAVKLVSPD